MWRGETIYSMEVHLFLFDRLGQLSSLALALQARGQRHGREVNVSQ
jgi:hypothetical protein